jgi:hypothetical protein
MAAQGEKVSFDEQGNLIAIGDTPISDDTNKVASDGVSNNADTLMDVNDKPVNTVVTTVKGNKYISMLATEKRATIDDENKVMFTGNQRAMAIAICIVAGEMLGCEFDAPQAKGLAARILVHVFGYSLAKDDVLRNGEVAASGMQKYVKYATGEKSRHLQYGGTAYGKLGSKPGTGYYIDSGMAQKLFDKYAPSEGYVASK